MQISTSLTIERAANILKLLGDKTRLTMMRILLEHDCCVCEFVEIFQMTQPSISQHLRKLKDVGLVKESRRGQWMFYSINRSHENYLFVEALLELLASQSEKLEELEKQGKRISCD
ncbi:metalloregulator ArsR/SmtB family transcription factor [Neobacillus sp. PS3-40]|uniref:ArsR/SmtB family transcription factor n=1 Tax=Neobacillus sp. PS3-40 TaxID=3070679 RepID=UPI0027DEE589|nr:metalloregulator ArsR/SmtB family transcription factor [Neobacillus sp. PS3-40]WML43190.1 metalloregulator ArsR/SmtB family transcription factor [Neobacillus sp. PS3-40]